VLEHARKRTPPDTPSLARTRMIPSGDSALTVYANT